ncbi:glutaredoxin family protein [Clostridium botulinum]|uniref:Glutaredoxin-like protein, YruB-family n=1 Tax=Clostridium botulinum (strain Eklund 17B / Type B) TaxID=935198 RepID=B2TIE8_CLOBB|nr:MULTISPECIES: glutaredoxin family protein [unclassified Clostridium]ACD23195.1 glutaredoxin-like protein, YruB-family [Clostridium botulinum B str. Eklund 17B (NRP)]AIY78693.1 glutaredoxin family protein [Clostridium botulinum 202F]KAI3344213.1 glutaredoxin family protein [Clostridium botulinum]KFX55254.1 glutaredoxin [Clostridium botulinum]KFX56352.1 glutaredoxin [Clostridium botulinum]
MVKVYTTDSCPWCVKVKNYLKSKSVDFEELNVQEDMIAREDMVKKSKQMGVPVLDINDTIIIGFDKPSIDEALNK